MTPITGKCLVRPMIAPLISKAIETSQFFLVAVTVPFYIFVLILMIDGQIKRINELNTPFFKLCISSGVIDLSTLFANYFGAMFPKFGLFTYFYMYLDGIYAHIYFCIAWSTGICQAMSVSVLATNRLSAMILPGSYHKMWLSHGLWIAIALQFIPGMLIGCLTFFNTTELVVNENNGIVPTFLNVTLTNIFFGIGGFFLLANCLYLTIAYCYLYISLRKRNKAASKNNFGSVYWSKAKAKSRKRERKLFIMSSITVAVQFLILLFFIIRTLQVIELSFDEFYLLYNALSDLFASINPYLLWIFSDSLRKHAFFRFGFRKRLAPVANNTVTIKTVQSFSMVGLLPQGEC